MRGIGHIDTTSPAVGAGIDVGLSTDYEGNPFKKPPAIGAHEPYKYVVLTN